MGKGSPRDANGDFRIVARNRRARFDYDILDTYEAGLVLRGTEVRSLRESSADLTDAWVDIDRSGQASVNGLNIPRLEHATDGHEEKRPRRLLLHRVEIDRLRGKVDREGMTLIVTKLYFKKNRVKIEVALARGRKRHDKRRALREREAQKEARQALRRDRDR